jgi:hypothetical protein
MNEGRKMTKRDVAKLEKMACNLEAIQNAYPELFRGDEIDRAKRALWDAARKAEERSGRK